METQETFRRSLFEQPSVPDNRCPQPVGPPKWELMAPITAEDIERSLKRMKDEGWRAGPRRPKAKGRENHTI